MKLLLPVFVAGCLTPPSPAQQVQDGENLEACVAANWGQSVEAVAGECLNSEIPAAVDLIADIEALVEVIAGTTSAQSPYASDMRVMTAVPTKLAVLHTRIPVVIKPPAPVVSAPKPTSRLEIVHLALLTRQLAHQQ
jgi:hypothetical protein